MAKTEVIANERVSGFHRWPKAEGTVAFLRDTHRHEFHVTAWKEVSHDDRQVEILTLKSQVHEYLCRIYPAMGNGLGFNFGEDSCERIALNLVVGLHLSRCRVTEDGENGAEVTT